VTTTVRPIKRAPSTRERREFWIKSSESQILEFFGPKADAPPFSLSAAAAASRHSASDSDRIGMEIADELTNEKFLPEFLQQNKNSRLNRRRRA
jgi:hypothetical protein